MSYIKRFTVTAPARVSDSQPFTQLRIRESASTAGPWSIIDTRAWSDSTPSTVAPVTIEVTSATLEAGFYEFQWLDGLGNYTPWYGPVSAIPADALFSVAEARDALGDQAYDEGKIIAARTYAQEELESVLGFSLVPRTVTEQVSTRGGYLRLKPYARDLTAVTVAGAPLTLNDLALDLDGVVTGYRWPERDPVTVSYTHGLTTVPAGAKHAALALAIDYLQAHDGTANIDPRAESIVTVDGTLKLRSGGTFANPLVDDWVTRNRLLQVA